LIKSIHHYAMIQAIAIDDEPKALTIIQSHASRVSFLNLVATFTDPFQGIEYINDYNPDLVFLDINMPDISGLKLLKNLTQKPLIIFTTAHSEYAVLSYEMEAVDYLLKPFDYARFLLAISKVKDRLESAIKTANPFFFVNTGNQKQRIFYADIQYLEGDGNYVNYHTKERKTMVRSTIKKTLELLPNTDFAQIHRSHIVALAWIDRIEDNHVIIGNKRLPIGATYRTNFFKKVNQLS
ncbi:MAG: LytTR family DNA-binding domain-containing protein, partial [Bacteroidota bacterium]